MSTTPRAAWDTRLKMAEAFVERLERYAPREQSEGEAERSGNRAALAALRRGLGKAIGEASEMYPYVVPALPRGIEEWAESCYYLVAALFGSYPRSWPRDARHAGLGSSLRRLALSRAAERGGDEGHGEDGTGGADGEAPESGGNQRRLDSAVERRFVALLNADADSFPEHLRYAVTLLKAHDVPVDWAQLLDDAQGWSGADRRVQRRWAGAFWASGARGDERIEGGEMTGTGADDAAGSADGD